MASIVLGWQIVLQPLIQRAPVETAIRLAPDSAELLRRAAEFEMAAGRSENAGALGREALARAPFDVRALRVIGLAEARAGHDERANEVLTLAGNWSLRDDPAHAWLVERRLQQGDYASAFAHADTLVRRRQDIQPQVFRLFTVAGAQDPQRALPVLANLLSVQPPWRQPYLDSLNLDPEHLQVQINLALLLEAGPTPLTDNELYRLYDTLVRQGRFEAVRTIRSRLNRPPTRVAVLNGDFSASVEDQILPFGWIMETGAGIGSAVVQDDLRASNQAFRVEYNGFGSGVFARQLLLLDPGPYTLEGEWRAETPRPSMRIGWQIVCADSGHALNDRRSELHNGPSEWSPFRQSFSVPSDNCRAQWLQLVAVPGDRRTSIAAWFDSLRIRASTSGALRASATAERGSATKSGT